MDAAHAETVTARSEVKDTLDAARAESAKTVSDLQSQVEAARAETAKSRRDFQVKLDAAVRASAEATTRANEWRQDQARAMREQAVTFVSRSLDRLLAVSASFAGVSTADDVWAAMVAALGTEFSRVALFKVADGQLQGLLRHVGFKFPGNAAHVGVPYPIDSVLDRSITSGQIETVTADALEPTAGTAFGGTPACGLALPIELDGEVCAVLYADDSDQPHRAFGNVELRRKFADLLRQQAAPLLMRLPTELKAVAEFREYAARLVAELENMYAADVNARKKGEDLRRRLKDNVECARGIYAQRVSAEAPSAADLIEEELALAVAAQRATAYGRDLTAVLGASDSARRTQAARASVEA